MAGNIFTHIRGILIVTPWVILLFFQDLLLSLLLLIKPFNPSLAYNLACPIVYSCWIMIQWFFTSVNGAHITISGDPLVPDESAVVLCNHVGWSDFYMIQACAIKAGMLGGTRYFAKAQLKKVPLLGWGMIAAGMPMVTRNWQQDKRELGRVFEGIVKTRWRTWLVSFSEGTRFTPKKYAESVAWCDSTGRPQPQHLLYPRTRGFIQTVQHLRQAPHVKAVYDLTIVYQHGDKFGAAPEFWSTLSVPHLSDVEGYRFEVHVRRFAMDTLPREDAELASWIEARWLEKGQWLEQKRVEWSGKEKGVK